MCCDIQEASASEVRSEAASCFLRCVISGLPNGTPLRGILDKLDHEPGVLTACEFAIAHLSQEPIAFESKAVEAPRPAVVLFAPRALCPELANWIPILTPAFPARPMVNKVHWWSGAEAVRPALASTVMARRMMSAAEPWIGALIAADNGDFRQPN